MQKRGFVLAGTVLLTGLVVAHFVTSACAGDRKPFTHDQSQTNLPACKLATMTPDQRQRHESLRKKLQAAVQEIRPLSNGYAFRYTSHPDLLRTVAEFITLESQCCVFFDFTLEISNNGGPIWLRVTGPKEARAFIKAALSNS